MESELTGTLNSMTCCWFCVISKLKLVAGTPLAELSYDHENVNVADSSSKVLLRAVTNVGVPISQNKVCVYREIPMSRV